MIIFIIWYIIGMLSYIYWRRKTHNLLYDDVPLILFVGLFGVFTLVMSWSIYGKNSKRILFKKRR